MDTHHLTVDCVSLADVRGELKIPESRVIRCKG